MSTNQFDESSGSAVAGTLLRSPSLACGESPVWEPFSQTLTWIDSGSTFLFTLHTTGHVITQQVDVPVAGLERHTDGGWLLGGQQGFHHLQTDGTLRSLANQVADHAVVGINEVIADPLGRVYGGQEAFRENEPYTPGYLYRVELTGEITIVDEGFHLANGMGFSPDGQTFYIVDTIPGHVYAYDYDLLSGDLSNRRTLITIPRTDGLTVDAEGFIWVARWFGSSLTRFDPDGCMERTVRLPFAQPTSIAFGGPNWQDIFVTSAAMQWVTLLAPTWHDYKQPRGGNVYRIQQEIVGKPAFMARA